jgi:hypothetical protein
MTLTVVVRDGKIVTSAPIARRFVGQHLTHLLRWMERQGDLQTEVLDGRRDAAKEEVGD